MAQWHRQITRFDPGALGTDFAVPVLILQGDSDVVAPAAAARDYLDTITAAGKELVLINNSGHLAMFTRPDQFLDELVRRARSHATHTESPQLH
jgi:pimeloyl-ACP methyl ester carboxylesterase